MKNSYKIKAGVHGAAGYVGGEVLRILLQHPKVEIAFAQSSSQAGKPIFDVHTDLIGETNLIFTKNINRCDIIFLCGGHGSGIQFINENPGFNGRIIDLSQDFRLNHSSKEFIYGLPELNKEKIIKAQKVANPGCFATAIQLALLPLALKNILPQNIFIQGTTGSTGAGQSLSASSHFSWRENNISNYKSFSHQHIHEINQSLLQLQNQWPGKIHFVPQRGDFTRGIFINCMLNKTPELKSIVPLYKNYYSENPFVFIAQNEISLKQVINTNKCLIQITETETEILIAAAIDNLLKGAAGQAVHNMNLMFGFEEKTGLQLKPIAY
jgi:N-acetyl-gamma-glutamyl-phosphate reductase